MITANHAHILGKAIAQLLGHSEKGSLAFLRCLPSTAVDALAGHADFVVPGYVVSGVVDKTDQNCALITADKAVELREDKDDPILLLIDLQRAGAGLDGIYSAGREIVERELFANANELARSALPRGFTGFTRSAVRAARQVGQRSLVSPWQEFDFLVGILESVQTAGAAVTQLGLWPIACDRTPSLADLELSCALVNRLLFNRELSLTPNAKVAALLLDDPGGEQKQELERFIRDTADLDFRSAVAQLLEHPRLWLNNLQPRFASEKLQEIELVSWRNKQNQIHKWSGLVLAPEGETPKFVIDRATIDQRRSPQLEVRWTTKPTDLSKGAVEYQAVVMSGDETLAVRTVVHKPTGPQKVTFSFEDFDELDENARFEAFVHISATGLSDIQSQETEQFILEFGHYEGVSSSSSGSVVRCFVEGAIEFATHEEFNSAIKALHLQVTEDKKGYLAWRYRSGRSFRVLRPSLIKEVEHNWTSEGCGIGRWSVRVRADGSRSEPVVFQAIGQGNCPDTVWERLQTASRKLCDEAARGPGLLAWVQASRWPIVDEYLRAWTDAIDQGPSALCLAHTVEVRSLAGQTLGLIVLPSHPLRLAWHAAYDQLAVHARFEQGMPTGAVKDMLRALDSAHFPFVLPGLESSQGFVFGDTLGFHAVAMVIDSDREPKAAISLMAACLADGRPEAVPSVGRQSAQVLAREIGHYLDCHGHGRRESGSDLDLLHVYAYNPGDGMTVSRALGEALQTRPAHFEEGDEDDERDLCFVLDLFPFDEQSIIAGRFLLDIARRRRAGAGTIDPADRWMLETVQRPGEIPVPRLRWARRDRNTSVAPAHIALAFDTFMAQLEAVAPEALPSEPRPLHGYGLINQLERQVTFGDNPTWRVFLPMKTEGEKHPESRVATERISRLHEAIARATALQLGGTSLSWPAITTRLPRESQEWIHALHRTCDWVVTADRNACIEYFDSPNDARTIYDAYVIDCVPERSDLGCLQLVTSTCNIEEVRNLLDEMLGEMGLSSSARNCEYLLWHLKGLSGRLAIRLANPATKTGELIALALVHAHCVELPSNDQVWLSLQEGFFIPLDEIADILPLRSKETEEHQRADLIFVSAPPRRPLEFRFVEVKFRRHLRTARNADLLEKMAQQTEAIRKRWKEYFFSPKLSPSSRVLRRSALARLLYFYLDKARRHHLSSQGGYERLRREIDKLLLQGDTYEPAIPDGADYGYIFCPELRTASIERLYPNAREDVSLFLFGPSILLEGDLPSPLQSSPPAPGADEPAVVSTLVSPASSIGNSDVQHTEQGPAASEKHNGLRNGSIDVVLGKNVANEEDVAWRLSIKANPHLMIVGLPGMGKTTCLINVCRQLQTAGVTPIIFSYHQDIDERLEAECGPLNLVDYNGLGFNPLQVETQSPLAHIDVASELRDIFAAIFPDLGDIQTEEIRQAIKQSYVDLGWDSADCGGTHLPIPPFQAFFELLRAKSKPNPGLMARLTELADYGFFSSTGETRSLLDLNRPSVLRIHKTSNELLQQAFASFVLYSIYKDMFKRGVQETLTHVVIFDEAHRASRLKLIPTMAKESRKYGIALILASQEARDFDPSLFSAIASYLALRVTENDAKTISKMVVSSDIGRRVIDRLKQLNKYAALFFSEGQHRPVHVALSP